MFTGTAACTELQNSSNMKKFVIILMALAMLAPDFAYPQRAGAGVGVGFLKRNKQQGAAAPAYYISANGNDANDGLTPATPKTFASVNSLDLTTIKQVLLKRGDSFTGTITVGTSGTSTKPITYGSYGSGNKPKIYGSVSLTGWGKRGGSNIYTKYYATDITQLFANGVRQRVARLTNTGYSTINTVNSQTNFVTNAASMGADYYSGARVVLRQNNYYSDTRTVTASTGSTFIIGATPSTTIIAGQSVLILNKLDFLDTPGEWYYNPANDTCYFWADGNVDPDTFSDVRGSVLNEGITISNKSYVTITNIDFLHQKNKGVNISTGTANNITVQYCKFSGQDNFGIYTSIGGVEHLYANNEFYDINGKAFYSYHVYNSIVRDNYFNNIGLFQNWGIGDNYGTAIEMSVDVSTLANNILYNTIDSIGYDGIYWRGKANVRYNYIKYSGMSKSDGGAIYAGSSQLVLGANYAGSVVEFNIIDYVKGEKLGGTWLFDFGCGIYLDENTTGITARNNTVTRTFGPGIFSHRGYGSTIVNNNVFDCETAFWIKGGAATNQNIVKKNFFSMGTQAQWLTRTGPSSLQEIIYASIDSNLYINAFHATHPLKFSDHIRTINAIPYTWTANVVEITTGTHRYTAGNEVTISNSTGTPSINGIYAIASITSTTIKLNKTGSGTSGTCSVASGEFFVNLATFRTLTNYDINSTLYSTALNVNETQRLVYNNAKTARTFALNDASGVKDENGTPITASFVLQPYTSKYVRGINVSSISPY
jgi:hypothetical protein